jgi:hypothetical protein
MSTMPTGFSASPDDSRLELSMAAMRSERRNRPRFVVVIALLVLVGAVANLAWTFMARTAAATRLTRATASLGSIQGVIGQLETMEAERTSPKYDPMDMVVRLQNFATQVGLPRPEVQAKDPQTTANVRGFNKRVYTTVISNADPEQILRWVAEATDGVTFPGLETDSFKLTPGSVLPNGKVGWTLDIAFRRWERKP